MAEALDVPGDGAIVFVITCLIVVHVYVYVIVGLVVLFVYLTGPLSVLQPGSVRVQGLEPTQRDLDVIRCKKLRICEPTQWEFPGRV